MRSVFSYNRLYVLTPYFIPVSYTHLDVYKRHVLKNDDATYSSMESLLDGSGYSLADKVTGFKAGTVTLDYILLKGAYDVE